MSSIKELHDQFILITDIDTLRNVALNKIHQLGQKHYHLQQDYIRVSDALIVEQYFLKHRDPRFIKIYAEENCVICLENKSTHAQSICGHQCVCNTCAARITKCPICREY